MAAGNPPQRTTSRLEISFLSDVRFLQVVGQVIFALVLIALIYGLATSILGALRAQGLTPNLAFLGTRAGFDITSAPEWYSNDSSYWAAYRVGFINTVRVSLAGLVASTFIGIIMGILLLSTNYLARTISRVYVEVLRNSPLLIQLFFWYFIVMFSLPAFQNAITLPSAGLLLVPVRYPLYAVVLVALWWYNRRRTVSDDRRRILWLTFFSVVFMYEASFWLNRPFGAPSFYGVGAVTLPFLFYLGGSGLLLAGAFFVPNRWRSLALGLTLGNLVGGVLLYFGVLPNNFLRYELTPAVYISVRGFAFPEILPTARFAEWLAFIGVGVAAAIFLWLYLGRVNDELGEDRPKHPRLRYAALVVLIGIAAGTIFVGLEPLPEVVPVEQDGEVVFMELEEARAEDLLTRADRLQYATSPFLFELPTRNNFRITSGTELSLEFMALFLGLSIYTSAFIAEIVRAGIQAVPYGQVEAARALGLRQGQVLQQIILPQALRVIIPPLGNQYLNLTKNSSLAIAIAFADLFLVTTTIMNQSGQSVTGMTMVMLTYLLLSLTISVVMNAVNRRFQLVSR